MGMLDLLKSRIQADGWLSISTVYFDNGYNIDVFATGGYVAMADSVECVFIFNGLDSSDSEIVENKYINMRRSHAGFQQNLTVAGYEHMQHFDIALYRHREFLDPSMDVLPYPTYPKAADLLAMEADPDTGLFDTNICDTVEMIGGNKLSVIQMYNDFFDPYKKDWQYSGARVKEWKEFYQNHDKFVAYLNTAYGISDAF